MDSAALEMQWRDIVDRHAGNLIADLSAHLHHSFDTAIHEVENRTRTGTQREVAEYLNQALRRVRQSSTWQDALAVLADSTSAYCERSAVFTLGETTADAVHSRGFAESDFPVPLAEAAAFRSAIDTKDPVVAMSSAREVSARLAQALGPEAANSVYLFPVVARQQVVALLLAAGAVQPATLELLCEMVALKSEATESQQSEHSGTAGPASKLVQLDGAPAATREPVLSEWERLKPDEQALHLQAQRFARVKVAEMRLYRADAVREGRTRGDLYGVLGSEIDRARQGFHQNFITASPTMVDYFHLELLRSLAHEDNRLLGPAYPGPLI
ncbi:MAG: hypothetical protein M3Z36_04230 [Acidobacteriota bacterium]|nr:hypothetical protein [Acidobacteriota bacterium]